MKVFAKHSSEYLAFHKFIFPETMRHARFAFFLLKKAETF